MPCVDVLRGKPLHKLLKTARECRNWARDMNQQAGANSNISKHGVPLLHVAMVNDMAALNKFSVDLRLQITLVFSVCAPTPHLYMSAPRLPPGKEWVGSCSAAMLSL